MARARKKDQVVDFVDVYQDAKGHYRWRARAGNGEIVGDSAEGYTSVRHTKRMAKAMFASAKIRYV